MDEFEGEGGEGGFLIYIQGGGWTKLNIIQKKAYNIKKKLNWKFKRLVKMPRCRSTPAYTIY